MLELDSLLNNYLESRYPKASKQEQQKFEELLDYSDPEIFDWIIDKAKAPIQFIDIINAIKKQKSTL